MRTEVRLDLLALQASVLTPSMFSQRTNWPSEKNPLTEAIAEAAARASGLRDLTASNPTQVGFAYGEDALAILSEGSGGYAPLSTGLLPAREAVANYYRDRGCACEPEHVVLAASTSELYAHVLALLCDPGESVLVPQPSYPLLPYIADLASVKLVPYPLHYDGTWHSQLPAQWPERARALVVVAPNNPTGNYLKRDELRAMHALAPALIVDEVFTDFPLEPEYEHVVSTVGTTARLTFTLSGLSKVALLPQLKLAWCVVSGPAAERDAALARLELIGDTFLSAAAPVQRALPALLALSAQMRQRVRARLAVNLVALDAQCAGTPLSRLKVEGGWSAVVRLPATRNDAEWAIHFVREAGVIVQPGYFYDLPFCACVVSLLTPPTEFREGLERMVKAVG